MSDQSSTFDLNAQYPEYIGRTGTLESGWNPHNVTGSNRGLFQWGPPEERMYGITNWLDRGQQISALNQEAGRNYKALNSALGQPPTGSQLYLAHQQGLGGARALLTAAPDQPAWMAVRPFYKSDAVAQRRSAAIFPAIITCSAAIPAKSAPLISVAYGTPDTIELPTNRASSWAIIRPLEGPVVAGRAWVA